MENKATIRLKVDWPEGLPQQPEVELQKVLQTWLTESASRTVWKCQSVTSPQDGAVEAVVSASLEHLFAQQTTLTLKHQRTALVTRVLPGDELPEARAEDIPLPDDLSSNPSSGPPEPVSCIVPLVHFWYVNQVYREKIKRIEEENRVQIQKDVLVSFNSDPSSGADPAKALSEFTDLVQSCLGDSNCSSYSHEPGQVDWERALQLIQQDREKLMLTVSPHEVEVCGPMKSLKTFETISKMQKKILNTQIPGPSSAGEAQGSSQRVSMNFRDPLLSSGVAMDPAHWVVITTLFTTKWADLEKRFGVKFFYVQDKVMARAETPKDAVTLESHALRALLCLYQRVATSVQSCSLQSQSQIHLVRKRLAGRSRVILDLHRDQWRIIGRPEDLRLAVDHIESDLGSVFEEEDKQRIGCPKSDDPGCVIA